MSIEDFFAKYDDRTGGVETNRDLGKENMLYTKA